MLTKSKILTVKELSCYIKDLLEREELSNIWVQGEISNVKHHSSGHLYFSMKDEHAVLRCVMFKENASRLRFSPTEGMKVIVKGDIRVYERKGYYQLYVQEMKVGGVGELYVAFLKLKEKLKKEGLFDEKYKKDLPKIPEKIGIITSPTGAAIHDIMKVIKRRYPVKIFLAPVHVQGLQAPEEIKKAIEALNKFDDIDLIILARGGGSLEDLWTFNKEKVARAIFSSHIPIISAIGHESDYTIADFVADRRAPTPSAAAEMAVPDKKELMEVLEGMKKRIITAMDNKINFYKSVVSAFEKRRVFRMPLEFVEKRYQQVDELGEKLKKEMAIYVGKKKECLASLYNILKTLSPISVLQRGYTICMKENGKVIGSVDMVAVKESMDVIFKDGEAKVKVNERKKNGRFDI
ncbi:MAG: exodeoxyribonuclease VII large subunit [Thermoplasmata archaeon]|nr:MAG: exodeoxyribonuclease VII large subunit [Thermoplasmata archaeon]